MSQLHRFVAFMLAVVIASVSAAQDAPKPEVRDVKVFALRNVGAQQVQQTLEALYGTENALPRFSADVRTNTLFATAGERDSLEIKRLIEQLDTPSAEPPPQMTILPLKNRTAEDAAQLVQELLTGQNNIGKVSLVSDTNANTLIVMGGAEAVDLIEELLQVIDVPSSQTTSFTLKNAIAGDAVRVLHDLFGDDSRFAVDERTNSVIVSAQPELLTVVEALLIRMDDSDAIKPISHTRRVRVIWLVSGLNDPPPSVVPDDLKGVVAELTKLGMRDVHLAAQVIVNTNGKFMTNAEAMLDSPCQLEVGGELRSVDADVGQNWLEIQIDASREARGVQAKLSYVNTELTTPLGHFVVLGVAPVASLQSAFVVQVTENPVITTPAAPTP